MGERILGAAKVEKGGKVRTQKKKLELKKKYFSKQRIPARGVTNLNQRSKRSQTAPLATTLSNRPHDVVREEQRPRLSGRVGVEEFEWVVAVLEVAPDAREDGAVHADEGDGLAYHRGSD